MLRRLYNEGQARLFPEFAARAWSETMKRSFPSVFLLVGCVACLAWAALKTEPKAAPDGWTTAAPRDEIRPAFAYEADGGPDGKGAFVVQHDRREGLDGWWTKTFPVSGGKY